MLACHKKTSNDDDADFDRYRLIAAAAQIAFHFTAISFYGLLLASLNCRVIRNLKESIKDCWQRPPCRSWNTILKNTNCHHCSCATWNGKTFYYRRPLHLNNNPIFFQFDRATTPEEVSWLKNLYGDEWSSSSRRENNRELAYPHRQRPLCMPQV